MIKIESVDDSEIIENHLRKNTGLNLYQIGDLDEFFRPYTQWHSLVRNGVISQIILVYKGTELPVLIALCDRDVDDMKILLKEMTGKLPEKFYSHLTKDLHVVIEESYKGEMHGNYLKMLLEPGDLLFDKEKNELSRDEEIRRMSVNDEEMIKNFYEESYPENWFDKRMLLTGKYFGYFHGGDLKGIAGIHVYSPGYKIAVLGNITTHPELRGRSVCRKVTTELCKDLFETVDLIGLNVHADNIPAIRSYESMGFWKKDEYQEYMFERKS